MKKRFTRHYFSKGTHSNSIPVLKIKSGTGFTLIEILIVAVIIGILARVIQVNVNSARAKARDANRIVSMKGFEKALEGYRIAKGGSYGNVGNGLRGHCYNYTFRRADGTCNALDTDILYQLKFGNSGGGDFLPNFATWNDPLKPIINVCPVDDNHTPSRTVDNRGAYDCKYITLIGEGATPQKYSLSCRVENVSSVSSNDGGINNNLFEIQKPSPWLCIWDVAFNNPAVTGMYGCLDVPTYTCHAAGT